MTEVALRGHPAAPGAALGPAWTARRRRRSAPRGRRPTSGRASSAGSRSSSPSSTRSPRGCAPRDTRPTPTSSRRTRMMADDPALVDGGPRGCRRRRNGAAARSRRPRRRTSRRWPISTTRRSPARAADLRAIARRAGELANGDGAAPPAGRDRPGGGSGAERGRRRWAGRIAGIVLAAERRHRARGDRRAIARDPARHRRRRDRAEDPRRRADRRRCRSRPRAAQLLAGHAGAASRAASSARAARRERALGERHEPAVTRDGRAVRLLANAGTRAEVEAALAAGADGIGLLRTELAFLDATAWPDEESHRAGPGAAARAARPSHRDRAHARFRRRQDAAVPGRHGRREPARPARHPAGARVPRGRRAATARAAGGRRRCRACGSCSR